MTNPLTFNSEHVYIVAIYFELMWPRSTTCALVISHTWSTIYTSLPIFYDDWQSCSSADATIILKVSDSPKCEICTLNTIVVSFYDMFWHNLANVPPFLHFVHNSASKPRLWQKAAMPKPPPIDEPVTPTGNAWWTLMDDPKNPSSPTSRGGCTVYPPSPWTPRELWGSFFPDDDNRSYDDDSGLQVGDSDSETCSIADEARDDERSPHEMYNFPGFGQCGAGLQSIELGLETRIDHVANHGCFLRQAESEERVNSFDNSNNEHSSSGHLRRNKIWEGETVLEELKDEIATLRERSDVAKKPSSKYKMMVNRKETARIATLRAQQEAKTFVEKKCKPAAFKKVAFVDNVPSGFSKLLKKPQTNVRVEPSSFRQLLGAEAPSRPKPGQDIRPVALEEENHTDKPPLTKTSFFDDQGNTAKEHCLSPHLDEDHDPIMFKFEHLDTSDQDLMKGVSTITTDDHNSSLQECGQHELANNCMPPSIMKKLQKLKSLKMSKTPLNANKGATMASLPFSPSMAPSMASGVRTYAPPTEINPNSRFVYETNTNVNSYVAYFRRGGKASESIRLYEHMTPDVFPTIEREVVVKIQASTVSPTDIQVRKGQFWCHGSADALNLPIVPGVAFCGIVHQTPRTTLKSGITIGDRVISLVPAGANARHLCISSDKLVKIPDTIKNAALAACIPETYLTAFQVLHFGQRNGARYRKSSLTGKCILVLGGATALGRALIEVAVSAGCNMIYATGKEKQFETIYKAGGAPLGRDAHQWGSIMTGRVDIMVSVDDSTGSSELRSEHMNLLKFMDGRLIIVTSPDQDNRSIINLDERTEATASTTGRKVIHYNVFEAWNSDTKQAKRDLNHIMKLLADDLLHPKILERIPLNRVPKAQDLMDGKKLNGFIVCEPWIKGRKKGDHTDEILALGGESPRQDDKTSPLSPFTAAAQRFSPLALFGDGEFWKTVTENSARHAAPSKPVDPNATPTAENLRRNTSSALEL